ncbi:transcriptional regulator, TetR family [Quadrisphaera granulorum]|uniref:TetR family transcriptional regulator n=1 Tax=Quadrisphaera granulorum TaxID=317664 RepID=A0A316A8A5_9ACTN|nr:TetR family transcriptional regulator [Quadrisphaera granulorum]PWJ53853.1 TetR family transcriptional regulator [Quadrisphaera granulorum]SZE96610.1 transcriptional regulator, TetR family [Quadrisphaera granulorum]
MEPAQRNLRARGLARRTLLLEAAVRVVSAKGVGGVTHRAVAAEAGVPASSTTYFFESLDDLIGEAVAHAMEGELGRLEDLRRRLHEEHQSGASAIDQFVELVRVAEEQHTVAQFEMYLFASRHPALQKHVTRILEATRSLAREMWELGGVQDPSASTAAVAMIDGMALHGIAGAGQQDFAALARGLRALLVGYVALNAADGQARTDRS